MQVLHEGWRIEIPAVSAVGEICRAGWLQTSGFYDYRGEKPADPLERDSAVIVRA
jgi:hypothetical protein